MWEGAECSVHTAGASSIFFQSSRFEVHYKLWEPYFACCAGVGAGTGAGLGAGAGAVRHYSIMDMFSVWPRNSGLL